MTVDAIRTGLLERQDLGYREFHSRLVPELDKDTIIGVRTPVLRAYAKELCQSDVSGFLRDLPHRYYEENCLHAFLIEQIRDFEVCLAETERFLPYLDNWATCDMFAPKVFRKHPEELLEACRRWLQSGRTYTVRYALDILMKHFLGDQFTPEILRLAAEACCEEYYVNMAVAWLFAEALARQYESALPYLTERRLSPWVHHKTIQKAVESRKIPAETKQYLKTLK